MEAIRYFVTFVDMIIALYAAWNVLFGTDVKAERNLCLGLFSFFTLSIWLIWWR